MNISEPFIRRPVATTLLTVALALAGILAFQWLPVAPLPQVEFPTISVAASLPGASPETMATSVAAPLERQFGRIAGVTQLTSSSSLGSTSLVLQFDLSRNIDAAARDVQAAINAARGQLPSNLPNNPTYRKVNPADAPIMILALVDDNAPKGRLYDLASTIIQQKLAQVQGVGQVVVGGSSLPAVRVELNPGALNHYGIGLEQVRTALAAQNVLRPKGMLSGEERTLDLKTNDQLNKAAQYNDVIVAYRNNAPVRLPDVASLEDSVEDVRSAGLANGKRAALVVIFRQPGANIIETVDRIQEAIPRLQAELPASVNMSVVMNQTITIRASVREVETTLLISIALVVLVVFAFLRSVRATIIPSISVPLSLIGTFGVMYLCGYSIDNLSLMALTISTGFVVDDAIVVIENITRYLEKGYTPFRAALKGAREIGFTVVSISISLVAVFIPLLLMGGIVGRLFREFAVTLSVAILVSLVISLTTTPMMCALLLRKPDPQHGRAYMAVERCFQALLFGYERSLRWVLSHSFAVLLLIFATIGLNIYLLRTVPKGFFPQQDAGRLMGGMQGAQDTSFQAMYRRMVQFVDIIRQDPAVDSVVAFTGGVGGSAINSGRAFLALKPLEERKVSADDILGRLRPKFAAVPGASLFLQSAQDLRIGGRMGNALYQYTLQSQDLQELNKWGPIMLEKMRASPLLADVSSDQQIGGLQVALTIDRQTAARLGVTTSQIDNTLYDAFGQRQVSTIYAELNQYHVVMELAPQYWQDPESLRLIYVRAITGKMVPLSAFAKYDASSSALSVTHQGQFPAATISFNLMPGVSLGQAVEEIEKLGKSLSLPVSIRGSFQGTAQAFQDSLANEPLLILSALVAVYIVLGILYESYVHPITILSTLPSAGIGAVLGLMLMRLDLSIIAIIGIILLIGIVKKNAIMMIDFALKAEREKGKDSAEAIFEACLLRFRPILMTTFAAMLGALPLALGAGVGFELRRPLGVTIFGGLLVSQVLTLYTTPVVYLYLDKLRSLRVRTEEARAARESYA